MNDKAVPGRYQHWLILSTAVLLASLMIFAASVVAGFFYFAASTAPMWVTISGVCGILGMAAGFGGLFLLLAVAGVGAWRGEKTRHAARG